MPRIIHVYEIPERWIVGTVGEPGDRSFFIQAKHGRRLISIAIEKSQVAALIERMNFLLREIKRENPHLLSKPLPMDSNPLENPIMEEFVVGVIGLIWLAEKEMISIEFQAIDQSLQSDDNGEIEFLGEDENGPDLLRIIVNPAQAQSFTVRATSLLSAGRPPCTFCGLPLNIGGHVCPRANGYRR
ncbi:unannotated protein [freshwater metagenome]|uniref:Unannotated protein n=1 Tax=freshwater metagenome TaxID=449393 RepID=A0A6J6M1J2_9ZZZZ|nr:DUF3090 family protein [Actinomycetota bacterium]